jgi:hypothetical protein
MTTPTATGIDHTDCDRYQWTTQRSDDAELATDDPAERQLELPL